MSETGVRDLAGEVAIVVGGSRNQGGGLRGGARGARRHRPVDTSFYRAAETPESMAAAANHSPRGRLGLPGDIAPVVGWLVSDEAGWVSGQTVRANGAMF